MRTKTFTQITMKGLDRNRFFPYTKRVNSRIMTITTKFKKDIQTLRGASNGDFLLDVRNPKLFKKVRRYYENEGIVFSGDHLDDYEILMEQICADLESIEVA